MTLKFVIQVLFTIEISRFIAAENLLKNATINGTTQPMPEENADRFLPISLDEDSSNSPKCEKRDKPYFMAHPSDLSRFYVCVKEQIFLLNCPTNYRFNGELNQCVRNSIENKPRKPKLIAHETNCGWYYVIRDENTLERVLYSCPMPQLFDENLLECRNYTEVKCQDRFEPKDACDYQIRSSAHAYPCSYMPSCKNRADGLYPDRLRDCRMYFRCTSERSSESFSCSQDTLPLGERFSVEEQRCLPAQYVECVNDQQKPF